MDANQYTDLLEDLEMPDELQEIIVEYLPFARCRQCFIQLFDEDDLERDLCSQGLANYCQEHSHSATLCTPCFDAMYEDLAEKECLRFK